MNIAIKLKDHKELMRIPNIHHWNVIEGTLNVVKEDSSGVATVVGSFHTWEYVTEDNSDEVDD